MNFLLIASDLGFTPSGDISPGGLQNFGRCVARALASAEPHRPPQRVDSNRCVHNAHTHP